MFDEFYQQSSDQLKLAFLQEAFRKHPELKEDFLAFYLKPTGKQLKMTVADPDGFILESTAMVREELESIDINEPDWEDYVPRHSGYIPEYEAMEHLAEDEIGSVLEMHVSEVESYCSDKHFDLAFLYMFSMYQACMEAELEDDYDTLGNVTQTLLDLLKSHLQNCMPLFKAIQLSEDQLFTITTVFFDQFQKHYKDDPGFLTFFEIYLHSIIHSGAEAKIVLDVIEEKKVTEHLPWLVSELHLKTGGHKAWEQSALHLFKKDKIVASSLLEFYKTDHKQEFVRIAGELWHSGLFRDEFASLYFETMNPDDDPGLYKEVTLNLNDREFSERYYKILQTMMSVEDRMNYIEKFKWNPPAYVRALCLEGKYSEALEFVGQHTNRWNIVEIFTPYLQAQPKPALDLLDRKIKELLINERGRNFYERIALVLKVAAVIPAIQEDAKNLTTKIYSSHTRLSALRDELRIGGLVKK